MTIQELFNAISSSLNSYSENKGLKTTPIDQKFFLKIFAEACEHLNQKVSTRVKQIDLVLPAGSKSIETDLNMLEPMDVSIRKPLMRVIDFYEETQLDSPDLSAYNCYRNHSGKWVFVFNAKSITPQNISLWMRPEVLTIQLTSTGGLKMHEREYLLDNFSKEFEDKYSPLLISLILHKLTKDSMFKVESEELISLLKKSKES